MGKFEIKKSKDNNGFYFTLKAPNHKVILVSENYTSKASTEKGIKSVKRNANRYSRFDERISTNDTQYFTLKAGNGEVIAVSQMYKTRMGMLNGKKSVMINAPTAKILYNGAVIDNTHPPMLELSSSFEGCELKASIDDFKSVTLNEPKSELPKVEESPILIEDMKSHNFHISKDTITKKTSDVVDVSPKLNKKPNVVTRIIQCISRIFMGNV